MKSVLIYTVHKAASMFLHRLTTDVKEQLGIDYYSINHSEENKAIHAASWKTYIEADSRQGCFGPIRAGAAEPYIPDHLESYSLLLHLRDPRDVLVSLYFSHIYSHRRKEGRYNPDEAKVQTWEEEGIDQFVLDRSDKFKQRYQILVEQLYGRPNLVFLKYEEMVSDYDTWLRQFLGAFQHLPLPAKTIFKFFSAPNSWEQLHQELFKKYQGEFQVDTENINQHKRQITPGDHRRKLQPETITTLNQEFHDILKQLQYEI